MVNSHFSGHFFLDILSDRKESNKQWVQLAHGFIRSRLMSMWCLPVYLLLDCSGVHGRPGHRGSHVRGVQILASQLPHNPQALESAYLSVITFARTANRLCP